MESGGPWKREIAIKGDPPADSLFSSFVPFFFPRPISTLLGSTNEIKRESFGKTRREKRTRKQKEKEGERAGMVKI